MKYTMKFVGVVITILLGMSLAIPAQAQTKQKTNQETKQAAQVETPITTQIATTDEGRKVILRSNLTWQYAAKEDLPPTPKVETKVESTLSFDTGIVFRSGDVKPVARTKFYLLDNSLVQILYGMKDGEGQTATNPRSIYVNYVFGIELGSTMESFLITYNNIVTLLNPHIIQSVTTDFGGKATFKQVPPGRYYVLGYTKVGSQVMGKGSIVWDVKVDLSPGNNSLTLDQNNAAFTGTD